MVETTTRYRSFVLRLWQESGTWRLMLRGATTEEPYYFKSAEALTTFLTTLMVDAQEGDNE